MKEQSRGLFSCVIKGCLITVICSLIAIFIFAFVIKFAYLNGSVIKIVNQFIKVFAILVGCLFALDGKLGLIKGSLVGVLSSFIIYLVLTMLSGNIDWGAAFIVEILFSLIVGGISGIIAVNMKNK